MNDLSEIIELTLTNGQPTTTSLAIAERFGKRHDNVLQSIARLECSKEFSALNFQGCAYKGDNGKLIPMYAITKDGFMFLAMGFTGKEAAAWKERFIAAFNAMERQLLENAAAQQIPKPDGTLFLSHAADIFVAADRSFRAAMRAGRSAGLTLAQALRRANHVAYTKTGIDMLSELQAEDHLAHLESGQNPRAHGHYQPAMNVARFLADWVGLKLQGAGGRTLPLCPCSGARLHQVYVRWSLAAGEQPCRAQDLIGLAASQPGWQAGKTVATWSTPKDHTNKSRKMVVPSLPDMQQAVKHCKTGQQNQLQRTHFASQGQWLSACFHAFESALEVMDLVAD